MVRYNREKSRIELQPSIVKFLNRNPDYEKIGGMLIILGIILFLRIIHGLVYLNDIINDLHFVNNSNDYIQSVSYIMWFKLLTHCIMLGLLIFSFHLFNVKNNFFIRICNTGLIINTIAIVIEKIIVFCAIGSNNINNLYLEDIGIFILNIMCIIYVSKSERVERTFNN